jgi:double-stranded uracil-DNA glycosylase
MKTEQINLRLERELVAILERLASEESLDRATLMRKLLVEAIQRHQLDRAIQRYQEGDVSLGRASEEAGMSQWELLEEIRRHHVAYPLEPNDVGTRVELLRDRIVKGTQPTRGFQTFMDLQGKQVLTLRDLEPEPGGVLLVGINPAIVSVKAGHYYQGRLGRRLWKRLERLGLLHNSVPGEEDVAFQERGHGISDVVKRPTASSGEVSAAELRAGAKLLREKTRSWKPGLVIFAFRKAAEATLETRSIRPGSGPPIEGAPTFLLSGPYAATLEAESIDAELTKLIRSRSRNATRQDR